MSWERKLEEVRECILLLRACYFSLMRKQTQNERIHDLNEFNANFLMMNRMEMLIRCMKLLILSVGLTHGFECPNSIYIA